MTGQQHPQTLHTFSDDLLGQYDATALAALIRDGHISPDEALEATLSRARLAEPFIHGLVTPIPDERSKPIVKEAASVKTGTGTFAGVPTVIKDNTDIKGFPTTHGTAAIRPDQATGTSPFARQLLAQGLVCFGKSTLPEFGFNATTEPAHDTPTRNPWNLQFSAGASSGGSAVMVAAGVVPIAHANDGGGSIRIPAACCGLVGLKPTRGRLIDNDAAKSLPINIVSDGVVTRSVRDTANFYSAAEHYFRNPKLPPIGKVEGPSARSLKIGLVMDSINGHPTDTATREAVESTARALEKLGHTVEPVDVPVASSFPEDFALYWGMLAFGVRSNGRRLIHPSFDKSRVDGLTLGLDKAFRKQFYRLPATLWRLHRSHHDYARAMAGYDAVLTPVLGHTTPEIGYLSPTVDFDSLFDRLTRYVSFTPLANATGAPAIALPANLNHHNLPVSVQLMGRHGGERTLLELAFALEDAMDWPKIDGEHIQVPAGATS
ncbi:amidase [Marinobacter sp. TBZ242]|uniref:Amidase n=1 Tax=Marinobacter azerbaijanicus TaxID=3050455 RepID=A0ABT7I893_9GAMM|nr:amidase [Marinobacter sp. TBZ242]MDL0430384.1 amidase [Marinobacter sp. TBZ242]